MWSRHGISDGVASPSLARPLGIVLDDFSDISAWAAQNGTAPTIAQATGDPVHPYALRVTSPVGAAGFVGRPLAFSATKRFLSFKVKADANLSHIRVHLLVKGRSYTVARFQGVSLPASLTIPAAWTVQTQTMASVDAQGTSAPTDAGLDDVRALWFEVVPKAATTTVLDIADLRMHDDVHEPGVIWTFDDARLTTYTKAFNPLRDAEMVGTIYTATGLLGGTLSDGFPVMTLTQLKEMKAAGWEIGSHSHTHPTMTSLTAAALDDELRLSYDFLADNGLLTDAAHFAYPGGNHNPDVVKATLRYYRTARTTNERNAEMPLIANRGMLGERGFQGAMTAATAKIYLDRVKARGGVLIVMLHDLEDLAPSVDYNWQTSRFQEVVTYARQLGLRNYKLDEIYPA